MIKLNQEALRFSVQTLACSITPEEVARALKIYFEVDLSPQELQLYDPTYDLSPDRINPFLIRLFAATRASYEAALELWAGECVAGYGVKGYRLVLLQKIFDGVWDGGDAAARLGPREQWLVINLLDEARMVSNDLYEHDGEVATGDARMNRLLVLSQDVEELLKDYEGGDDEGEDS